MSAVAWLSVVAAMMTFALGFLLSWLQMRKRLQRRVNEVVVGEVARRMEQRVLDELRGQAGGSQSSVTGNDQRGDDEHE